MKRVLTFVMTLALLAPASAIAQVSPDVWRGLAQRVDPGTEIDVRLQNGQRFHATLVAVREDAVLLQPKTRVTVPVQAVRYDDIALIERRAQGGMSAGKAVAIGVASGAGTFLAILAILFATFDD